MFPHYLAERIRDAANWHASSHGRTSLRSEELRPQLSFFDVFKMCPSAESVVKYQAALVGDVCLRRSVLLQKRDPVESSETEGRILVLDVLSSLYDSLASEATGGFFDESDSPPWDFWIDYEIPAGDMNNVRGMLSAWIPKEYYEQAEEAILVSGGDSLYWGSESHVGFEPPAIDSLIEELERTVSAI